MPIYLNNADIDRLVGELSEALGEGKTETVLKALRDRKARLLPGDSVRRRERLRRSLEREVWNDRDDP